MLLHSQHALFSWGQLFLTHIHAIVDALLTVFSMEAMIFCAKNSVLDKLLLRNAKKKGKIINCSRLRSLNSSRTVYILLWPWYTCASRGWLPGSPGLFTALFASLINFADSATTSWVALIRFNCKALSSAVAATPLAAAVNTCKALAVSLAAMPV